jgi:hypothetical protein
MTDTYNQDIRNRQQRLCSTMKPIDLRMRKMGVRFSTRERGMASS